MYIKIQSPIPDNLIMNKSPFGSRTYGTENMYSDHDEVHITYKSTGDFVLQYKLGLSDIVYVDWNNFIRITGIGGNQNFFETMHTKEYQKCALAQDPLAYYTPIQARGYVGLAHRDLKPQFVNKRIWHINRCLWIADKIMKKELINLKDIGKIPVERDIKVLTERMTEMRNKLKGIHND